MCGIDPDRPKSFRVNSHGNGSSGKNGGLEVLFGREGLSKIKFVKSQTWFQDMARINGVLRPEGPLLPAQAVRPGGQERPRVHGPFRAEYLVNRAPGLSAWAG